jgi:hypothetical protein
VLSEPPRHLPQRLLHMETLEFRFWRLSTVAGSPSMGEVLLPPPAAAAPPTAHPAHCQVRLLTSFHYKSTPVGPAAAALPQRLRTQHAKQGMADLIAVRGRVQTAGHAPHSVLLLSCIAHNADIGCAAWLKAHTCWYSQLVASMFGDQCGIRARATWGTAVRYARRWCSSGSQPARFTPPFTMPSTASAATDGQNSWRQASSLHKIVRANQMVLKC